MVGFVVTFLLTAVTFLIMIRVSIGLDVDNRKTALLTALVVAIFNAALHPLIVVLPISSRVITFLLLAIVMNVIVLYLMVAFIKGFRINGFVHALIVSITLGILNTLIYGILAFVGV